jgi:hypothetical protein
MVRVPAILALLAALTALAPRPAAAQVASLMVVPAAVAPGGVTVTIGYGFAPFEDVTIESQLGGVTVDVITVPAAEDGSIYVVREVPAYAPTGLIIQVVATGTSSGLVARATVRIVAPATEPAAAPDESATQGGSL